MARGGRALGRVWAALAASLAALFVFTFIGGPALAASAPVLIKSFGAPSIPVGATTSLNFTVFNSNGAAALTGIGFTDTFPAGLAVSTPNGFSSSCGGTFTAVAGSNSVSLSGVTLPAASSCTIQLNVTPSAAAFMTNTTGAITSNESGPGGTATATLTVTAPTAPVLIKSFGAPSIPVGGTTSLSFTVTNTNASASLTGVGFTDLFPAGLAVSTPNGLSNTCGGTFTAVAGSSSVSLSGVALAASSSCTIQVNVTPSAAANMTNTTGQITSNESGPGGTATAFLTVTAPTAPVLVKSFGAPSIFVGGTTSLSFTVSNTNASASLTGVGFTDSFPPGLAVSTPNGLFNTCGGTFTAVAGSGSVSLSGAALPANSSCTIQLNVTPSAPANMSNTAGPITSNESGPGGDRHCFSDGGPGGNDDNG